MLAPRQVWLGIYTHRHGTDYVVFDKEITIDELKEYWKDAFEEDREDEYLEVTGPLPVYSLVR